MQDASVRPEQRGMDMAEGESKARVEVKVVCPLSGAEPPPMPMWAGEATRTDPKARCWICGEPLVLARRGIGAA